jgi:hypothetical protein
MSILIRDGQVLTPAGFEPGWVLVAGGQAGVTAAELYDPVSDSWSSAGALSLGRGYATLGLLPDGRALQRVQ